MALLGDFIARAQGCLIKLDSCQLSPLTLLSRGDLTQGFSREESNVMSEAGRDKVFISYAHADNENSDPNKRWLDRLLQQLEPLCAQGLINIWSDKEIEMGDDWHDRIQSGLSQAKAAVLLISPAFLASKYIRNSELPVLLKNAKDSGLIIIPIFLRNCLFAETKFKYPDPVKGPQELSLASLQSANPPDKPLNALLEHEQDAILLSVARRLLKLFQQNPPSVDSSDQSAPDAAGQTSALVKPSVLTDSSNISTTTEGRDTATVGPESTIVTSPLALPVSDTSPTENTVHIFIGDAGFESGSPIALVGCIILEDVYPIKQRLEKIREDLLHDPIIRQISGVETTLRKNGFNYLKDDPEIRTKFAENMRGLLFEAYICSANKKFLGSTATEETENFDRLLGRLMYERLRANRSRPIRIWLAQKHKHYAERVQAVISSQILTISQNDRVRLSAEPVVDSSPSGDLCSSVADYVCHLVLKRVKNPSSLEARDFEKIRSKVRVVHKFDTDEFFTRNNPLP